MDHEDAQAPRDPRLPLPDSDDTIDEDGVESQLAPGQLELLHARLRNDQSLVGAVLSGATASILAAVAWGLSVYLTEYQTGLMAIAVGLIVGFAVRIGGRGIDTSFSVIGGGFSLLGCVLGNLFVGCLMLAQESEESFALVVGAVVAGGQALELLIAMFEPMDILFYGIAVYEGYRLSPRPITAVDVQTHLGTSV